MANRKSGKALTQTKKLAAIETAAAKRAEALLSLIARRKSAIADAFYDIGEALREILKKKLYAPLGHASFDKLLAARKVIPASAAYQLIEVVESLPREKALAVGSEKAYALARFSAATANPDPPATLIDEGVPLGPKGRRKPIDEVTIAELEKATKKARTHAKKPTKRDAELRDVEARIHARAVAIAKRLKTKLTTEAHKRGDEWWVVVQLPVAGFERL
ncbi:MAG: hypothetical protein ACXWUG_12325 [Polyangiales bacterium]